MIAAFCFRCVGMHPDMAGVNHQPFIIRLINQNFQEFFPNIFSAPTDKPLMNNAPLPVTGRQVTPGRPCSQYPKNRIDKTAIILSNPAPLIAWASIYKLELAKSIYNRLRPFLRPQ